ncbi:MAG: transcription elongation factor GreA [Coriobacteriia bacterium]|nr:transcription elongation factor GreA [Coriobacteriia bacterium]MCL2136669.1 transcription elongation factor GreA [Coriobacteriia bacterium]
MAKEITLTPEGKEKLQAELYELETVKRIEIGERIRVAREFGDISENSEYDDAKNEQAWIESRIAEITQILANSSIVELPKRPSRVVVGSQVTVAMGDGSERKLTIVDAAEADSSEGRISHESPVGAALLSRRKGEVVQVDIPNGTTLELTVLKIG